MAEIPQQYTLPLTVASYDVGADNRLRLSAVLRYQQEAAERQLIIGGCGWDEQLAHGMVFVTSRWEGRFVRLPSMGERVTVTTWHRDRRGARFNRCYVWMDESGARIGEGVMVFALVSTDGHRLLRGDELDALVTIPACDAPVDVPEPKRFSLPPLAAARTYTVGWSDTDRNGHMNNTRYPDLACDALGGVPHGQHVARVSMHFAGETRRDETITLAAAVTDAAYVQGDSPRGTAFTARLVWECDT